MTSEANMALDNPGSGGVVHRAGTLKQQNKSHKHGKHRSKGSIDAVNKGRVPVKVQSKRRRNEIRREERRHQAKHNRQQKREQVLAQKRHLGGSSDGPPHFVAILSLSSDSYHINQVMDALQDAHPDALLTTSSRGVIHLSIPQLKRRFAFLAPPADNLWAVLDACKIAHTLLLVAEADVEMDQKALQLVSCVAGQWLPSCVVAIQGTASMNPKRKSEAKRNVIKALERLFPVDKVLPADSAADAVILLRQISLQKQPDLPQRDSHAHLLAEEVTFLPYQHDPLKGTLKVSGYVMGRPLSVNALIHIPGWGDFQMEKTTLARDPHPLKERKRAGDGYESDADETQVLEEPDPDQQESLQTETNLEDRGPDGDQCLGSDNEEEEMDVKKEKRRVPKGTSAYQAAWIFESDEESDDDMEESEGMGVDEKMEDDASSDGGSDQDNEDDESLSIAAEGDPERYNQKVDIREEEDTLQKIRDAREEAMFPDEVDTPADMAASVRFQKYRGLHSFRTSPWDPKEDLLRDYSRVFQFRHFRQTARRVAQAETVGALPGWYITLHIKDVPASASSLWGEGNASTPLLLVALLPHEQKMSVINLVLRRPHGCNQEPIRSKERLLFHVGFRRFYACPIFSQHAVGNKHKFERFFQPEATCVATMFAPITFPPASVLVFTESSDGSGMQELVAAGSLLSVDPDRVVIKRAVLSGHPYKIHRRSSVIRYMFFRPEDIRWFKPVQLHTKLGRRGHIQEPLGTHGHMKCVFNGQLKSQDTVLMNLYKRVFPKWTYDPYVACENMLKAQ